jgi:ABC-type nitrate/sulfonate/bicarbonate transport system substrate-binding protein
MAICNGFSVAPAALGRWAVRSCWLAVVATAMPGAVAADTLVLQLHREPQFEFAGYYAALWKGFYRDAGLAVEIKPGHPPGVTPVDPVREVIERRAQFGTGTAQLLIRAAQGSPLVLLAPIFQQSGAAVYYRTGADFSSARAFLDAKLGRLPPSNILDLELRSALTSEGIDPDKLKSVSIEPGQAMAALADRRVDAVVGSAWELPWQAQERSLALKSFGFVGHRPEFYGDGLFALQRFANADPATAQRFREASIKGWEYALQHPDEIAAKIIAELPVAVPVSDPAGFARYQSEVARKLAHFPDAPLGRSDPERWNGIEQSLMAIGAISHPVDLKAYLYDPDVAAWGFGYRLTLLIATAGAVCALFLTAGHYWRRRHRSNAVPAQAPNSAQVGKPIAASFDGMGLFTLVRPVVARLRAMAHDGFDWARDMARQLAQSTAGSRPVARATDLNVALTEIEGSTRRLPHTVKCRLSLPSEVGLCHAAPDAVTRLVRDLVAEAAADMPDGGELVVGTRKCTIDPAMAAEFPGGAPGDYVRVTVKDSGPGLSPEGLERIFFPQVTVRPAAAASWRLTRRVGGFAAVESAEGVGTAVHLYFRHAIGTGKSVDQPIADDILKAAE